MARQNAVYLRMFDSLTSPLPSSDHQEMRMIGAGTQKLCSKRNNKNQRLPFANEQANPVRIQNGRESKLKLPLLHMRAKEFSVAKTSILSSDPQVAHEAPNLNMELLFINAFMS